MKMLIRFVCLFFVVIFTSNLHAEETWKIASSSWPPYADPEIEEEGSSIHKLRELLKLNLNYLQLVERQMLDS